MWAHKLTKPTDYVILIGKYCKCTCTFSNFTNYSIKSDIEKWILCFEGKFHKEGEKNINSVFEYIVVRHKIFFFFQSYFIIIIFKL